MIHKFLNKTLWLLPLAAVTLVLPSRSLEAGSKPGEKITSTTQTAPAVVQDSSESLRQALLARLEFEELSLNIAGVATFQGQTVCFIKHPGSSDQMIYRVGDVIGGYLITAIDQSMVTFERGGHQFFLTSGESSDGRHVIAANDAPRGGRDKADHEDDALLASHESDSGEFEVSMDGPALDNQAEPLVQIKAADDLKRKTQRFESARLIEELNEIETRSSGKSSRGVASASGRFALPVRGTLTSGFGYRRHPFGGYRKFHRGIDIAAPRGTDVAAAADGVVTKVRYTPTLGRYVTIRHANGYETRYGHLSRQIAKPGDTVKQGDIIGEVGSTGVSTGNHLHFEILKNQIALDPQSYVRVRR